MRRQLGRTSGGRVLDVATGHGDFALLLVRSLADYDEVIGIDTDQTSLATARRAAARQGLTQVRFRKMDAASLLFPDASFDTVAVSNSLHHLRDPRQVLAEMMRVLKPAGLFIVREMYRDRLTAAQKSHLLFHHLRSDIDTANGVFHRHTYQRRVLERMYRSLGLTGFRLFDLGAGDDDPRTTEAPRHLIRMLDIWRRRPVDLPGIRLRIEAVEKHIRQHGFLPASSLVGIGRKPRTGKR